MSNEFFGATLAAQQAINRLLALPAFGREQDWEIELASPDRIPEMLELASQGALTFDEKCALSLLLIASIEEANEAHTLDEVAIRETQRFLAANPPVRAAMDFFWIEQKQATDESLVREILTA